MVKNNQNYDVNYKLRQAILNSQGGSNLEDINALKRRISLLEQNKQDNLIAGQGILILGNNISAENIINDTVDSLTTVWSSRKIKDILNSFNGRANVVISDSLPSESEAIENTIYYIGDSAPYNIWFFLNGDYIDVGTTDVNLEDYYTKIETNELLELKVDKEEGKVLIPVADLAQITANKEDILGLEDTKVDKEEGKTLISIQDLNKILTLENDVSDLDEGKVDKEQGKTLISEANITQIATNKDNIYNLENNKVDKISGKSLVLDSDIAQITTNKNSITSLSMNKQDKLTAGTRIILNGNEINTVEFINDSITSATNTWSSNKIKGLFDSLSGKIEVRIVSAKPESPTNSTMYYVGSTAPYDIWFYVNDEYTYFGTTDIDLSNYYTKSEVDNLLDDKVDKVAGKSLVLDADIAQITTNKNDIVSLSNEKVDKEVGKSLVSDTDIAQISTNKTNIATLQNNKQDKITDSTLDSISDSTTVSSVSASSKTNKTFSLSALWNWITNKLSTTISSSSTNTQIPSAKAVWDSVYTDVLNYSSMSGLDDILSAINVQDGCSKFAYITNLTPVQTAGASSKDGFVKVSKNNNKAMIEFFPSDKGERWWVIKNTTWGDWTNGAKYMHTLVRYNNEAKEYTMGWFSIINEKKTMTLAEIKDWLSENNHTSIQSTYHFCGGCLGTIGVRNSADTGTAYVGKVASGVYYNPTSDTIFFKFDYNGTTSIVDGKYGIISTKLS